MKTKRNYAAPAVCTASVTCGNPAVRIGARMSVPKPDRKRNSAVSVCAAVNSPDARYFRVAAVSGAAGFRTVRGTAVSVLYAVPVYCEMPVWYAVPMHCALPVWYAVPMHCAVPVWYAVPMHCAMPVWYAVPMHCAVLEQYAVPVYCAMPVLYAVPMHCAVTIRYSVSRYHAVTVLYAVPYPAVPAEPARAPDTDPADPVHFRDAVRQAVPVGDLRMTADSPYSAHVPGHYRLHCLPAEY